MVDYDNDMNSEQTLEQSYTFRLFRQLPSFWNGFASLINFGSSEKKYQYDSTPDEADMNALRADWHAIGGDLKKAITLYERERKEDATAGKT
jgi:hypothetical protein